MSSDIHSVDLKEEWIADSGVVESIARLAMRTLFGI